MRVAKLLEALAGERGDRRPHPGSRIAQLASPRRRPGRSTLLKTSRRGASPAPISSSTESTAAIASRRCVLRLGGVDDVHDEVGERGLLERRLERLDQLVRKLADEADRVGQQVAAAVVAVGAGRRVERVEEPLPHPDPGAGERVEEGRLAGVRVAGERDDRERRAAAARRASTSRFRSRRSRRRRRFAMRSRARRRSVSICDSPGPLVPIPPPEPLEVGPQAPHPREVVLELGQLDLELALGAVGVVGEDVEDHRRAVDHRHAERLLEVALLARHELVVAGDEVGVRAGDLDLELGELARGRDSDRDPAGRESGPSRRRSRLRRCAGAP